MDVAQGDDWFDRYIEIFSGCGRNERPVEDVVPFYSKPLLLTTDDGRLHLKDEAAVTEFAATHIAGLIQANYDHSVTLERRVEPLNAITALVRGRYSRRRADESEISSFAVTYLITRGPDRFEISAMATETPER